MATILNAVSGTGLTQSADASGQIKIQSNGVTTNALAWVNFNGVTTANVRASYNVSSVVRNSSTYYTINFTNQLTDANYAVTGMSNVGAYAYITAAYTPMSTTAFGVNVSGATEPSIYTLAIFGN